MPSEALAAATIRVDGPRMRELRKLAGHNLSSFGQVAAIHPSYVSHIERGVRAGVSPAVYARICDALGIKDRRELMRSAVS